MRRKNVFQIICAIFLVLFIGYKYVLPKIDTSWVVDVAVSEVKRDLYNECGEISVANGEIKYKNGQDYIVIVKFKVPELDWEGSYACYVYGYRKSNAYVTGMTYDMAYDYPYNIEELKVMWNIE